MTPATEFGHVLLDASASELAFEAGQILQRELVAQALALARSQTGTQENVVVTADHVRASLGASLLDKIRIRLGVGFDGEPGEQRRVSA